MPNKIGVVGLGYVGLPAAIAFSEKFPVIGFDISSKRVNSLKQHVDYTGEVSKKVLNRANILFTEDPVMLKECGFIIVTVPTPIDLFKRPDLSCLISASEIIGNQLQKGTTVIYESTVYPGATEEICIPILEKKSGLKSGEDFFVGYSPERINPGDKEHTFKSITKVISAQNKEAMYTIAKLYRTAVDKVYIAPSIKVAEASKIIENIQRDINIALMNELAMLFHELEIDTSEVLRTANTKWNFLQFTPGLVGGHCIGVDPYYLTSKAENMGYHPEMILTGRKVNEGLSQFIVSSLLKLMTQAGISIEGSRVTILGFTFKENISDIRNSKVFDMIQQLNQSGAEVQVSDELADPVEVLEEYDLSLYPLNDLQPGNAVIVAVPHQQYKERGWEGVQSLLLNGKGIVLDIKNVLDHTSCPEGITLWRL
ncbi:nucleotide sugar dehydrogenase [Metabacillus idriensis]|uniref:nucleotide sugar dehydrogenase n=1 Tax=Metabacillus idriensis TaxID=324768 RepID=UPI001CD1E2DC|nr:nucleotide sugar dehydrogenase [Metabacillus idriensis]